MNIYLAHSRNFDYQNNLYTPIKTSTLWKTYKIILPHETNQKPTLSKHIIETCDLVIAEISYPSIGLGIELGWAHAAQRPILCLYKIGTAISTSLPLISSELIEYVNLDDMIQQIQQHIHRI